MMTQLKLQKNVGKNCYPDPSDVMIVQTCLANIKTKTKLGLKPLWQGKIDGRNSKELVCAIENFQVDEGLKVTGKVEAYGGQTFSKLKLRTPTAVVNQLVSEPFMGSLKNDHIFKAKQEALKKLIQAIKSLPHNSVGSRLEKYWRTLKSMSDPVAQTALDIQQNRGAGRISANWLKMHIGDLFVRKFPPSGNDLEYKAEYNRGNGGFLPNEAYRIRQNDWVNDLFRQIQVSVAVEHWNTAAKDGRNIKGKLSADQIARYHHKVFSKFGLPKSAFGGTVFSDDVDDWPNSLGIRFWCKECDTF
jgi:hypothetical protein